MKTFINWIMIFSLSLFISISCKTNTTNVDDAAFFDKLIGNKELISIDPEVEYIIKAKEAIDAAQIQIMKLNDRDAQKMTDKDFTKQILATQSFMTSMLDVRDAFRAHITELLLFSTSNNSSGYEQAKGALMIVDDSILETGKPVLEELDTFTAAEDAFQKVLEEILEYVSNSNFESAQNLLADESSDFLKSAEKLLDTINKFEVARCKSVLEVYNAYKGNN